MNVSRCFAYSVSIFLGSMGSLSASELLMPGIAKECVRRTSCAQFTLAKAMFPHSSLITVRRWYTDNGKLKQLQEINIGLDEVRRTLENIANRYMTVPNLQGDSRTAFPSLFEGRVTRQDPTFLPVKSALATDDLIPSKAPSNHQAAYQQRMKEQPVVSTPPVLHMSRQADAPLQYSTEKPNDRDAQRLKRLYGLLPEIAGKSITGVLAGETINKQLPIWASLDEAINQIKKEAVASGDQTKIDLAYFKTLYSKYLVDASGKKKSIGPGAYSISTAERERLNRLYLLLPNFAPKSITGAVSGETINQQLPIWAALDGAIQQIKNEIAATGEKTIIDLKYFRKLHWASIRVTGKGGGRAE